MAERVQCVHWYLQCSWHPHLCIILCLGVYIQQTEYGKRDILHYVRLESISLFLSFSISSPTLHPSSLLFALKKQTVMKPIAPRNSASNSMKPESLSCFSWISDRSKLLSPPWLQASEILSKEPHPAALKSLTHRNCEIINVCCFKLLSFLHGKENS